jgi:hypothetical protein
MFVEPVSTFKFQDTRLFGSFFPTKLKSAFELALDRLGILSSFFCQKNQKTWRASQQRHHGEWMQAILHCSASPDSDALRVLFLCV